MKLQEIDYTMLQKCVNMMKSSDIDVRNLGYTLLDNENICLVKNIKYIPFNLYRTFIHQHQVILSDVYEALTKEYTKHKRYYFLNNVLKEYNKVL